MRCILVLASVVAGGVFIGCTEHGRSPAGDAALPDARPDALPPPRNDPGEGPLVQPFDATFVTPAGAFEAHTLFASAIWGDCNPPFWELRFSAGEGGTEATVTLHVSLPEYTGVEITGSLPASASYQSSSPLVHHSTQSLIFHASRLDYPGNGAPRITGRFVDNDPVWTIDLDLDVLGLSAGCI